MRHRITIFSVDSAAQDAAGQPADVETELATQWASIEPLTGRESWLLPQVVGEVSHKITTRYVAGVTPKHRIRYGSREFDIVVARNLEERGIQLEILASESV
jgi:SPP1 family predicted phage head-tail adaptor